MNIRLDGKVAVVTGSSSGIGKAVALQLAEAGAAVVGAANRNVEGGLDTVRRIESEGGRAAFVQADVSKTSDCSRLIETAVGTFGGLDILVNNAGVTRCAPFESMSEQLWNEVMDIDLRSAAVLTRLAVPCMAARDGGSVINVSSVHAVASHGGCAAYAAAKAGLCGLTRALAVEYGCRGIRVNCVLPGTIDLSLYPRDGRPVDPRAWSPRPSAVQVMGRLGSPAEIAAVVCFLASDYASFINGVSLPVDGGLLCVLRDA